MGVSAPAVSIVLATYNSSHLLRHAIGSVLLSDFDDWELIVVGDHCTDDTEACVAGFGDDRIRFINLERNSGQQATPNNVGVVMARGEYLAFLNQDDMYLPHHLSSSMAEIRSTGADIVCSIYALIHPDQLQRIASREIVAELGGYKRSGRFSPRTFRSASSWFLRREVAEAVGPWRLESQTFVTPSQDWLFRAWRSGKRIHCSDDVSVVVLYSGLRPDSYCHRDDREHAFLFREVVETDALRARMLDSVRGRVEQKRSVALSRGPIRRIRKILRHGYGGLCGLLGVHPNNLSMIWQWGWRRGAFISALKKTTG